MTTVTTITSFKRRRFPLWFVAIVIIWMTALLLVGATNEEEETSNAGRPRTNTAYEERMAAKPWFLRDIQLSFLDVTLPMSPMTVLIAILALVHLIRGLRTKRSWAEASHILLSSTSQDNDDNTKQRLEQYKTTIIQNDVHKFATVASKYSVCPSGKTSGGNLGKFYKGDMAPPFDRVVFDPKTPLQQTVGPIETQFGYHLIYIHKREILSE